MLDTRPEGISRLIAEGESESVEFRRRIGTRSDVSRVLLGMAKRGGGLLLVGVDQDSTGYNPVGLSEIEARRALDIIRSVRTTTPGLKLFSGRVSFEGKTLVYADVRAWHYTTPPREVLTATSRLRQFAIEASLLLVLLDGIWYLWYREYLRGVGGLGKLFPHNIFPSFALSSVVVLDITVLSFLGLIFYGTAYEVSPFVLVSRPLRILLPLMPTLKTADDVKSADRLPPRESTREELVDESDRKVGREDRPESIEVESEVPISAPPGSLIETPSIVSVASGVAPGTDVLFREVSERASYLADRMERRTNTYMIVGVAMGFIGMAFWFWSFNRALTSTMNLTQFVETAIPRVTILVFIELLAGFFLRQYRIGVEDFKYFFEIEQKTDWKRISHAILSGAEGNRAIEGFANSLAAGLASTKLQSGESTPTLEAIKAEGNFAMDAMKVMSNTIQELSKNLKPKR